MRKDAVAALLAATVISGSLATASPARADTVSPKGKGIAGGVLLGGEVVTFAEAIIGVRAPLAYIIGAGLGAAGGGVGGFFLEKNVSDGTVPAYLLAGGLAALIPAIVVALDQTRYLPSEGAREDKPSEMPASDPGRPGGSSVVGAEQKDQPPAPATPPPAEQPPGGGSTGGQQAPLSLVDVHQGDFRLGMPIPQVRPMFTATQEKALAVKNDGAELRFPVVNVVF